MALSLLLLTGLADAFPQVTHEPVLALEATLCDKYQCNGELYELQNDQCIFYDAVNSTYFVQLCSDLTSATYCPISYQMNSSCEDPPSPTIASAWPGEYCLQQNWCKYGYCSNHTCVGQILGAHCSIHDECNPGLRCLNGTCAPQLLSGQQGCSDDFDCVNTAGCDADTCSSYFQVPSLEYAGVCLNSTSLLCQTGFCYFGVCIDPPVSMQELPVPCASQFDCISNTHFESEGLMFYTDCQCGMNPSGAQYCDLFMGDPPALAYLTFLQGWLNTTEVTHCNTVRRLQPNCILTVKGNSSAEEFVYYETMYEFYPQVADSPECVQTVFHPYQNTESQSRFLTLGVVSLLIYLFT